ncbi:arylesterase [Paeniroseomonas aquatica]|uniref:arylesterase n=1 Tax=Paeniroseomonas aquatica TaxID=373043 RepID=UPI00360D6A7D
MRVPGCQAIWAPGGHWHRAFGCRSVAPGGGAGRGAGSPAGVGRQPRRRLRPAAGPGLRPRLQAALAARGRAVRIIDAGVSGDTTAGGLARLDWALADRPQAALVELGGNDGLRGLPPRDSRANLAGILDKLAAAKLPVLLAGMLAPPNLGADYGREFAAMFTELARARPEVLLYPFFLDGVAGDAALNQPDGIHPNPQGVAIIVRRILPMVETLLDRVPPA